MTRLSLQDASLKMVIKLAFDCMALGRSEADSHAAVWQDLSKTMAGSLELEFMGQTENIRETKEKIVSLIVFKLDKGELADLVIKGSKAEARQEANWATLVSKLQAVDGLHIAVESKILRSYKEHLEKKRAEKPVDEYQPAKQIKLIDIESVKKNRAMPFVLEYTPKGLSSPSPEFKKAADSPHRPRTDSPSLNESVGRLTDGTAFAKHATQLYKALFEKLVQKYAYAAKPDVQLLAVSQYYQMDKKFCHLCHKNIDGVFNFVSVAH